MLVRALLLYQKHCKRLSCLPSLKYFLAIIHFASPFFQLLFIQLPLFTLPQSPAVCSFLLFHISLLVTFSFLPCFIGLLTFLYSYPTITTLFSSLATSWLQLPSYAFQIFLINKENFRKWITTSEHPYDLTYRGYKTVQTNKEKFWSHFFTSLSCYTCTPWWKLLWLKLVSSVVLIH